mmetsp:Transcript_105825/g.276365  ORF Transcript_105825/g.276365 Transcript_105825/m.276365 type:complete len:103 (+) Transcript_105825:80-388(+)
MPEETDTYTAVPVGTEHSGREQEREGEKTRKGSGEKIEKAEEEDKDPIGSGPRKGSTGGHCQGREITFERAQATSQHRAGKKGPREQHEKSALTIKNTQVAS